MSRIQTVLLGEGAVGKSALCISFLQNGTFLDEYDPTIEDSYARQITVDQQVFQLDILDTAGQEEYSAMREAYMAEGEAFICCFATNFRDSFDALPDFVALLERVKDLAAKDISIVIVGTKMDLVDERQVTHEEAARYARHIGASYIETSSYTGYNVPAPFTEAVRLVVKKRVAEQSAEELTNAKRGGRLMRRLREKATGNCKVL